MPSLSDLNGHHEDLAARVVRYAERLGWRAVPVAYHEVQGGEALKLATDDTGLYVRTLPDMVVTDGEEAVLLELKTHVTRGRHDATPELYPIVAATVLYRALGVRTLYVYEDPVAGISGAWWAHAVFLEVPVSRIFVGAQRQDWALHLARIRRWQSMGLVPANVEVAVVRTRGSGDPFVVVPEEYLRTLLPWHYVLEELMRREVAR